eukprot:SAG11_NODE_637_length_8033_cov_4.585707_1_plen_95_part_00
MAFEINYEPCDSGLPNNSCNLHSVASLSYSNYMHSLTDVKTAHYVILVTCMMLLGRHARLGEAPNNGLFVGVVRATARFWIILLYSVGDISDSC